MPNRNGCAINFADPWANTPGGDPLKAIDYPRQGEPVQVAPSGVTFPVQGGFVSMPVDLDADAGDAVEPVLPAAVPGRA